MTLRTFFGSDGALSHAGFTLGIGSGMGGLISLKQRCLSVGCGGAALGEAMQAAQRWMREDAGSAFRHLSDAHHEAIAAFLVPVIVTAYHGITEGTIPLEPQRYLDIVNGEGI